MATDKTLTSALAGLDATQKKIDRKMEAFAAIAKVNQSIANSVKGLKEQYAKTSQAASTTFQKSLKESAKQAMGGTKGIAKAVSDMRENLLAQGFDQATAQHQALMSVKGAINKQQEQMAKSPIAIGKAVGAVTVEGFKFIGNKLTSLFDKGGAAETERENEQRRKDSKLFKIFDGIKERVGGMWGSLKDMAKKSRIMEGAKGLFGFLKKAALFLAIPALIAFMNSPLWPKLKTWISDKLIPALTDLVAKIKPIAERLFEWVTTTALPVVSATIMTAFEKVGTLLDDLSLTLSGEKGWVSMLTENIGTIGVIAALLFPKATFKLLKTAVKGLMKAIRMLDLRVIWPMTKSLATKGLSYVVKGAQALRAAIIAMNASILAPMMAALGPALVAAAPFVAIAAAVALAIYSIWEAFEDAKAVFDETGNIWLSISEGLSSFLATFLGFIPDIVISMVAWGAEKLGFKGVAEWLRSFDIIESLKGMFRSLFDNVFLFIGILFSDPVGLAKSIWEFVKGIPGKVWDWVKTTVLGWFGLKSETDKIEGEVDAATKPEPNWLQTLFAGIFPDWLLHPVKWIKGKLGITDADTIEDASAKVDSFAKGVLASIGDLFKEIFPEWITSPIKWIKGKLGLTDETGKLTDKGAAVAQAAEGGIGAMISELFGDIFPEWITSPIQWIKGKLGLDVNKPMEFEFPGFPTIADIKEFLPRWLTDPIGWVKSFFTGDSEAEKAAQKKAEIDALKEQIREKELEIAALPDSAIKGRAARTIKLNNLKNALAKLEENRMGGFLPKGVMSLVGEAGPELIMSGQNAAVIASHQLRAGMDFARMSALAGTGPVGGTSGQVVNNIVNSVPMTTTNVANTRVNTAIGVNDPFTNVAVAY